MLPVYIVCGDLMGKPIFIAFTGPASAGKTTLVEHLAKILGVNYKVYVASEIIRDLLKEWNTTLDELLKDPDLFYKFQVEGLTRHIETESRLLNSDYDIVLLDRSVHDYFIYTALGLQPSLYNEYRMQFKDVPNNYNLLIYCEHIDFTDDGVRSKEYINRGELGLFQTLVKPYTSYILDNKPHWQRIRRVLGWLEGCLNETSESR